MIQDTVAAIDELYLLNQQNIAYESSTLNIEHFRTVSVIGKGSYAKVILARKLSDNKCYAIKMLKKKNLKDVKQQKVVQIEKEILAKVDHPFVVKLAYAFQNNKYIYFCLEFCPGGELFNLLSRLNKIKEVHSKFYAACIILAIEYLHSKDIVYRDLKPENVLIDRDGYVKIADFGLSKPGINGQSKTFTLCGTAEYLSPEAIKNQGYGKSVDWWSLGCFIFEIVVGVPPFHGKTRDDLKQKILVEEPKIPMNLSNELKNLLKSFFEKDPTKRIGFNGANEIKKHNWFNNFDWELLQNKKMTAPFVPNLKGDDDITNFDEQFTSEPIYSPETNAMSNNTFPMSFDDVSIEGKSKNENIMEFE